MEGTFRTPNSIFLQFCIHAANVQAQLHQHNGGTRHDDYSGLLIDPRGGKGARGLGEEEQTRRRTRFRPSECPALHTSVA